MSKEKTPNDLLTTSPLKQPSEHGKDETAVSQSDVVDELSAKINQRDLQDSDISQSYMDFVAEISNVKIEKIDKRFLKGFLSYVGRLYATGEISESAYIALINQAAETYAQRLIDLKVSQALDEYTRYIEKATIRWFS